MNTTVYLMRHSKTYNEHYGIKDIHEDLLFSNIKTPLSVAGEKMSEKKSLENEFQNLDVVWSSNYVRAMSTAKYFAHQNNLKVNISDRLGERKHGVSSWDELPIDYEIKQFEDENYKIGTGESKKETMDRMCSILEEILNTNKGKRILVVSHATAIAVLLSKWCEVIYNGYYKFNNEIFFGGNWDYLETFKLEFNNENKLISIENISRG